MQNTIYTYENKLHNSIINLCHKIEFPLNFNKKGPKIFSNYQRVGLIILFLRSKKALRNFVKELHESRWVSWLGLKEIPGKSTLNDWFRLFNLDFIRNLIFKIIEKENPKVMAIDATGIDSWQRSRHYEKRIGDPNMPYAKADFLVDTDTMLVHDFVIRIKPRHDVVGAKTILNRLKWKNIFILGDKGYDSEAIHKLTIKKGSLFFAPVRDFKVKKPKGKNRQRCLEGDERYPRRNCAESLMHALKSLRSHLRNKLHYMKKREMAWTIVVYNLEKLIKRINVLIKLLYKQLIPDTPFIAQTLNTGLLLSYMYT